MTAPGRPPACDLCGGGLVYQAGPSGWIGCDCCGNTQAAPATLPAPVPSSRVAVWSVVAVLAVITAAWIALALTSHPGDDQPGRWAAAVFTGAATIGWPALYRHVVGGPR